MRKQDIVTIDGDEYEINQLGAIAGRRVLTKLLKLAGPALGALAGAGKLDEQAIGAALASAAEELDEATLDNLCETFGEHSTVRMGDGRRPKLEPVIFDNHFAGRYLAMSKWLAACLKLNFADFLGGFTLGSLSSEKAASK